MPALDSVEGRAPSGDAVYQPRVTAIGAGRAIDVITQWEEEAAAAEAASLADGDARRGEVMRGTQDVLALMRKSIVRAVPKLVFAIHVGDGHDSIQALATVTPKLSHRSKTRVVEIHEIVAKPDIHDRNYADELVRGIKHRVGDRIIRVDLNAKLKGYYRSLGFEPADMASLGALRYYDADPAVAHLPLQASAVISEWEKEAAAGFRNALSSKYSRTQRVMEGTQSALHLMRRTISDGIPKYVFALAAGEGAGDILAMATVAVQVGRDDRLGRQRRSADIFELVARPTGEARRHIGVLVHRIYGWAGGVPVRISKHAKLHQYYTSLGVELEDGVLVPSRGQELRESASERGLRLVTVELGAGPGGEHARPGAVSSTLV